MVADAGRRADTTGGLQNENPRKGRGWLITGHPKPA